MNVELEDVWRKAVMIWTGFLSQHLPRETKQPEKPVRRVDAPVELKTGRRQKFGQWGLRRRKSASCAQFILCHCQYILRTNCRFQLVN